MEEDDTLKEALLADARDDLLSEELAGITVENEASNSSGDEENQHLPQPHPASLSDVAADFGRVEGVAQRGQMTEVLGLSSQSETGLDAWGWVEKNNLRLHCRIPVIC